MKYKTEFSEVIFELAQGIDKSETQYLYFSTVRHRTVYILNLTRKEYLKKIGEETKSFHTIRI